MITPGLKVQFWVLRVLMHGGRKLQLDLLTPASQVDVMVKVEGGALALMPDNSIAEPVEGFDEEPLAAKHREELRQRYPNEDFRVVMTTDAVV